jgi:hypothetical protein
MDIAEISPPHPEAIAPVMRVTKAAIASEIKILSSSASFMLSNRLGNCGSGFLFIPKNFVLL